MTDPTPEHKLNAAIHAHQQVANAISHRLEKLAWSLETVGMDKLAGELFDMADELPKSATTLSGAYHNDLNLQLETAEAHSGLLLKAILAGVFTEPSNG